MLILRRLLADILFVRGNSLFEQKRAGYALWHFALAARLVPGHLQFVSAAALAARDAGQPGNARRYAERTLAIDPGLDRFRLLLTEIALPGDDYLKILDRIHQHLNPRTYVEVGVSGGSSIRLARPGTAALGIDPTPAITGPMPPNVRIFAETSDEFFAKHDVRAELGGLPIDLAFIDGMHHFEFALRDFMNIERLSTRDSTILIHDCYPLDEVTARRERIYGFWTGDVWRLVVLLKKYRPDLSIHTIAASPSGLCMVRNLNPASRFIHDNLDRLREEFMELEYSYLAPDPAVKLNLTANEWARIKGLLCAGA